MLLDSRVKAGFRLFVHCSFNRVKSEALSGHTNVSQIRSRHSRTYSCPPLLSRSSFRTKNGTRGSLVARQKWTRTPSSSASLSSVQPECRLTECGAPVRPLSVSRGSYKALVGDLHRGTDRSLEETQASRPRRFVTRVESDPSRNMRMPRMLVQKGGRRIAITMPPGDRVLTFGVWKAWGDIRERLLLRALLSPRYCGNGPFVLMHRLNDVVKNFILDTSLCAPFRLLLYVPERFDTRSNKNCLIIYRTLRVRYARISIAHQVHPD